MSTLRRLSAKEEYMLGIQANLSTTYQSLGRREEALLMKRDVYSRRLKLLGKKNAKTIGAAIGYGHSLTGLKRYEEAKALLRKPMRVARRVLGENHNLTIRIRWMYAAALYKDPGATLDDLSEAVTTLEEVERTARRVFGGGHLLTRGIARELQKARNASDNALADPSSSPQPKRPRPSPSPSIKEMKAAIRQAGLGVADLLEKSDVEARYAQAQARLAAHKSPV